MKYVNVRIEPELHNAFRIACIRRKTSMTKIVVAEIKKYLELDDIEAIKITQNRLHNE